MPLKRRVTVLPYKKGDTALIDADIVRYQSAAACDVVHYEHVNTGHTERYHRDMVAWCRVEGYPLKVGITKHVTPAPVTHCLHTIKEMIQSIMEGAECSNSRLFLTGKGNYREQVAVTHKYKGERVQEKPTHFEAAGEYLRDVLNAEVIEGKEADDALAYEHLASPTDTVICTQDKDLLMVTGNHYCWSSGNKPTQKYFEYPYNQRFEITQEDADKFFYMQLLMGDKTDNIHGIIGVGPVTAEKMLTGVTDPYVMYEIAAQAYADNGLSHDFLVENAHLLWMQREKDVMWTVPQEKS